MSDNLDLRDLTILLLGMAGAGKSTLINMFANILAARSYREKRLFAIPCTQKVEVQVGRKTLTDTKHHACNIDQFEPLAAADAPDHATASPGIFRFRNKQTGRVVTLVDSPGLGDSRGEMFEELQVQAAVQAVLGAGQVDMVCIVHNATETRLRDTTKTALARLHEVLGPQSAAITAVCLTHSPKNIAPNCIDALQAAGLPTDSLFRFENSCLVHPDVYSQLAGENSEEAGDLVDTGARSWTHNERTAKQLLEQAAKNRPVQASDLVSQEVLTNVAIFCAGKQGEEVLALAESQFCIKQEFEQLDSLVEQATKTPRPHNKIVEIKPTNTREIKLPSVKHKMNLLYYFWSFATKNYGTFQQFLFVCLWLGSVVLFVFGFGALFGTNRGTERYDHLQDMNKKVDLWPILKSCGAYSIKDTSQPLSTDCLSTQSFVNSNLDYRVEACKGDDKIVNISYREERENNAPRVIRKDYVCIRIIVDNKIPDHRFRPAEGYQNTNFASVEIYQQSTLVYTDENYTAKNTGLNCTVTNTYEDNTLIHHQAKCSGIGKIVIMSFSLTSSRVGLLSKLLWIVVPLLIVVSVSWIVLYIFARQKVGESFKCHYFVWVDVPYEKNINEWRIIYLDAQQYDPAEAERLHKKNLSSARDIRDRMRNNIVEIDNRINSIKLILNHLLDRLAAEIRSNAIHIIGILLDRLSKNISSIEAASLSTLFMRANRPYKLGFMWTLRAREQTDPQATDLLRSITEASCFNDIEENKPLMARLRPLWNSYQNSEKQMLERARTGLQTARRDIEENGRPAPAELTEEQRRAVADLWRGVMETDTHGAVQILGVRESQEPLTVERLAA